MYILTITITITNL